MATTSTPTLFGPGQTPAGRMDATAGAPGWSAGSTRDARDLMDLLYDGFYMIFLLRNGHVPVGAEPFRDRIRSFLTQFERGAQRLETPAEDVYLSKFAYCALVDEVVLSSNLSVRDEWERRPLQLEFFGEQLAGERFFEHLETLRGQGAKRIEVLEVFHMCLLLGFQGRYVLEGSEKLNYLSARVGDEIAQMRGKRAPFAPHWAAPDRIVHKIRREVPLWVMASVFALAGLLGFMGLRLALDRQTSRDLAAHANVIQMAPQAAHVTITLP